MNRPATPWDALLRTRPVRRPKPLPASAAALQAQPGTKLAGLLAELERHRSMPTLALAVTVDLTPNQVWGLLKCPRDRGQVSFDGGRWSLNRDWPGADVMRAAALLRSKGWVVEPPEGKEIHV